MTEFAWLLFNGPTIQAQEAKEEKPIERKMNIRPCTITRYKGYAENGFIHTLMVFKHTGISHNTIANYLREMCRMGVLEQVGRVTESKSSTKPYLYRFKDAC